MEASRAPAPRRLAALLLGGSLLVTCVFPLVRSPWPFRTSGGQGTDLASHWGSALLLAFEGPALYRVPSGELCAHPVGVARPWRDDALTCAVRGHPALPAFVINWPQYPRVYPPGCQLLMAPLAMLFVLGVPFSWVNALAMVGLLLFGHLATLLLARLFWRVEGAALRITGLAFVAFAHVQLVVWALGGMYDVVPLAAVLAGVVAARDRRFPAAFVLLALALFLHYRALWYLPLFAWAAAQVARSWGAWARREKRAVIAAVCAPVLAGASFVLSWPALHTFPESNVLRSHPALGLFVVPAVALGALAVTRSWLTLSCAGWQLLMLSQTRELRPWHVLLSMPLVAVATLERRTAAAVLAALALVLWQGEAVFGANLFSLDPVLALFAD